VEGKNGERRAADAVKERFGVVWLNPKLREYDIIVWRSMSSIIIKIITTSLMPFMRLSRPQVEF